VIYELQLMCNYIIFYDHLLLHDLITELGKSLRVLVWGNYPPTQIEIFRTRVVQHADRKMHGGSSGQCLATVDVVG